MSLYDDMGGEPALRAVLQTLYDRLFDDVMVGFLFAGKDKARLIEHQLWFTARFLGGPSRYEGKWPCFRSRSDVGLSKQRADF